MTTYQFEDYSPVTVNCQIYDSGSRVFVKDAVTAGAYVEVTLPGMVAGFYDLNIHYAQGLGTSVSPWQLRVNGSDTYMLYLPNTTHWADWQTRSFQKIQLTAGTNTLRFTQYGAPADFDYFELIYSNVQAQEMPERLRYWTDIGETLTTPARQNVFLNDSDFTSSNYNLTLAQSNRILVCKNTSIVGSVTLTLIDANWQTLEPYAEIEIIRMDNPVSIVAGSGISIVNSSNLNLDVHGFAILKHVEANVWLIKGDLVE